MRRQFFLLQKRAVWKRRTPPACCAAPSTPGPALRGHRRRRTHVWFFVVRVAPTGRTGSFLSGALPIFCRNGGNPRGVSASVRPSFSSALVESVSQATRGILSIGSYVLLVSILLELLRPLPLPPAFRCALTGFLEVTTGCSTAAPPRGRTGALLAAFFLAFGGCSVCLQVLSLVKPSGIRTNGFFRARLLGGFLCMAFLFPFLPDIPEPTVGAALISASSDLLPAANSPNRLLGAFCMMAMTAQLFTRIDGCTIRRRG